MTTRNMRKPVELRDDELGLSGGGGRLGGLGDDLMNMDDVQTRTITTASGYLSMNDDPDAIHR